MYTPSRFVVICCCDYHKGKGKGFFTEWGMWVHIGLRTRGFEHHRELRRCEHGLPLPRQRGFEVRFDVRARMPTDLGAWRREE